MANKEKKAPVEKEPKTKGSKVTFAIGIVLCVILIPILIINCTLIINGFVTDRPPSVFGYTPLVVLTESMDPLIAEGDVIFAKDIDADDIKVGDVISFFDPASPDDAVLTHRVIAIETDEEGNRLAITAGDNNAKREYETDKVFASGASEGSDEKLKIEKAQIVKDEKKPGYEYVVYGGQKDEDGKVTFEHRDVKELPLTNSEIIGIYSYTNIPAVGKVVMFMQSTWGWVICIAIPLLAFLAYELISRKKKDNSKAKDMDALLAELEALKAAKAAAEGATTTSENAEATEAAEAAENDSTNDADNASTEE